jgi:hypothetical protein
MPVEPRVESHRVRDTLRPIQACGEAAELLRIEERELEAGARLADYAERLRAFPEPGAEPAHDGHPTR